MTPITIATATLFSLTGGNDIALLDPASVPEPNAFFMLGIGLLGLLVIGKFRRNFAVNI